MAHKTPKLLKIPALPVCPYCGSFYFLFISPQYKRIKAIAGYGVMGSKLTARRRSEPAGHMLRICLSRRSPNAHASMALGSSLTLYSNFIKSILVSVPHLGQYSGKRSKTVSSYTLVLVFLLQDGHRIHLDSDIPVLECNNLPPLFIHSLIPHQTSSLS